MAPSLRRFGFALVLPGIFGPIGLCNARVLPDSSSPALEADGNYVNIETAKTSPIDTRWDVRDVSGPATHLVNLNKTSRKSTAGLWEDEVARGKRLVGYFDEPDITKLPQQSPWTAEDLGRWGWRQELSSGASIQNPAFSWLARALRANGVSIRPVEPINHVVWVHDTPYKSADGTQDLQPTGARYDNWYCGRLGVIVATNIKSPADSVKDNPNPPPLPDLQRWSDVTWLQWTEVCRALGWDAGLLQYVFHSLVVNEDTEDTAHTIRPDVGNWPGLIIPMDGSSDNGPAMLGTPNGRGTGWLLVDHREHIKRRVNQINWWKDNEEDDEEFFMMLKLAPL